MSGNSLTICFLSIALKFFSGSIMYAPLLARLAKVDLSKVRDGNPGSSNLWHAAGWKYGIVALALDYFKGTFPLFLFIAMGLVENPYIVSLAAVGGIAGHAFSPFLKFRGGKAVATTFGAWSVLTKWKAPTLIGAVFTLFSVYNKLIGRSKTTPEEDAMMVFLRICGTLSLRDFETFGGKV